MFRMRILYLILLTIIIAMAFNAGVQSTKSIVGVNNTDLNPSNVKIEQMEREFSEIRISNDVQSPENNDTDVYMYRVIYVLTVLLSALMICILIAIENDLFFLHRKEQKVKARYELEVFAGDQ